MHVISLIVKNEFGVMQRVMGEFTRNKINVETIVVGKCEVPQKSRMVLSVIDREAAETAMGRLEKLQDVYDAEMIPSEGQSAYALMSTSNGNVGLVGGASQVEEIIERSRTDKYVMALNAL
ncbi:MAG: acetolactate synthase [Candidatus Methanoplasma sp.]|jgi:acetolactate synthase-1/3 small subunit|nr:acetolactate synthase [Candidatus Methanoplasma sp.]